MEDRIIIDPGNVSTADLHQYLLGTVAPRPIAFASTLDLQGRPNLAPYSFFNCFSSNPPILVFSSNRRVEDNTTKDTLHNIRETKEVVINAVSYAIVRQMAISSVQYEPGISEFEKSGLTPLPSDLVKPFRVAESPVNMECRVKEIIELGDKGGAGHLILCEVLRMHIRKDILDEDLKIDPQKIDLVARMGRAYYARASGDAIFSIFQPVNRIPIGFDGLPESVKNSNILTGNDLGKLIGLLGWPDKNSVQAASELPDVKELINNRSSDPKMRRDLLHALAKSKLEAGATELAAAILLAGESSGTW